MNKTLIKKILLVWLIACFTINTTAVAAMMVCHEMGSSKNDVLIAESTPSLPCHEAANNQMQQPSIDMSQKYSETDDTHTHDANCDSFSCGHCPSLTQFSPPYNLLNCLTNKHTNYPPHKNINVSSITETIDYPPKILS